VLLSLGRVDDGGDDGDGVFLLVKNSSAKSSRFMIAPH
jgi:hypothetical protein